MSPTLEAPPEFVTAAPPVLPLLELPAASDVVPRAVLPPFDVLPAVLPTPPALNTRLAFPASQPPRAMAKTEPLTNILKQLIVRVDIFAATKHGLCREGERSKTGYYFGRGLCAHGLAHRAHMTSAEHLLNGCAVALWVELAPYRHVVRMAAGQQ